MSTNSPGLPYGNDGSVWKITQQGPLSLLTLFSMVETAGGKIDRHVVSGARGRRDLKEKLRIDRKAHNAVASETSSLGRQVSPPLVGI